MLSLLATPEFATTAGILTAAAAVAGAMVWAERRPRDITRPRLLPTTPILFVSLFVGLVAVVHLINLLGFQTGR